MCAPTQPPLQLWPAKQGDLYNSKLPRFLKTNTKPNLYGPCHTKICLRAYADSDGPDKPAHPRSLIRVFTVCKQSHWILYNVWMKSEGPDDTLCMRMTWLCAFCACSKILVSLDAVHMLILVLHPLAKVYKFMTEVLRLLLLHNLYTSLVKFVK